MITLDQLRRIMPYAGDRAAIYLDPLNQAMAEFGSSDSGASLGDILGAALSKAKKKKGDDE